MFISVRIIGKPRKIRQCCVCDKDIKGRSIDVYGMADIFGKPQHLYIHRDCVTSRDLLKKVIEIERQVENE